MQPGTPAHTAAGSTHHPLFDPAFYRAANPLVAADGLDAYDHYRRVGSKQGFRPHPLFSPAWYGLQAATQGRSVPAEDLLRHYMEEGDGLGISPSPYFSPAAYREFHRDVPASDNALIHFLHHGRTERRDPHPLFETAFYVAEAGGLPDTVQPLVHYVLVGASRGLRPHPDFDVTAYRHARGSAMRASDPLLDLLLEGGADVLRSTGLPDSLLHAARRLHTPREGEPAANAVSVPPTGVAKPAESALEPRRWVVAAVPPPAAGPIRIAVLDVPDAVLLPACARDAVARRLPLQFVVFGPLPADGGLEDLPSVWVATAGARASLGTLRPAEPCHAALIQLSGSGGSLAEAFAAGLFPVVCDARATVESAHPAGWGRVVPAGGTASAINDCLVRLPALRSPPPPGLMLGKAAAHDG